MDLVEVCLFVSQRHVVGSAVREGLGLDSRRRGRHFRSDVYLGPRYLLSAELMYETRCRTKPGVLYKLNKTPVKQVTRNGAMRNNIELDDEQ